MEVLVWRVWRPQWLEVPAGDWWERWDSGDASAGDSRDRGEPVPAAWCAEWGSLWGFGSGDELGGGTQFPEGWIRGSS